MIWFHPQPPALPNPTQVEGEDKQPPSQSTVPRLSTKREVVVFRTRSKLERDSWCWALNCEIEKIVRVQKDREERMRDTGKLGK